MMVNTARKGKEGWKEVDIVYLLFFPTLLLRMLHNQIWISLARFQTARSRHLILDRGIEFEQVDRERNWSVPDSLPFIILHARNLRKSQLIPLKRYT